MGRDESGMGRDESGTGWDESAAGWDESAARACQEVRCRVGACGLTVRAD
jgi:hypothetical protein